MDYIISNTSDNSNHIFDFEKINKTEEEKKHPHPHIQNPQHTHTQNTKKDQHIVSDPHFVKWDTILSNYFFKKLVMRKSNIITCYDNSNKCSLQIHEANL